MADVLTPRCPLCGWLPVMVFGGGAQAFCGNDDCTLIVWNSARSVDENLMDSKVIHLPPMTDDTGKTDG